ncbi:Muconolactone Delta-isomerase [Baekduia alba]|uniref:muconolactone Delta-isomerase n=1 Tax=Baekduia alba TaxID=2997333 RepID=UPI00234055D3|nr:muconolactone Delta-isomerase family protein [Baekduia alba]WCB92269.1 Muconolactone Delta-isomerase [Baekduia alba]
MEFLTHIVVDLPAELSDGQRAEIMAEERERSAALAARGIQKRLWRDPARRAVWALWEADDATALHEAVSSLALFPYMTFDVHPLARHANDPALGS